MCSLIPPDFVGDLMNEFELAPLIVIAEQVADDVE
jgi:hypothetical protein